MYDSENMGLIFEELRILFPRSYAIQEPIHLIRSHERNHQSNLTDTITANLFKIADLGRELDNQYDPSATSFS